MFFQILGLGLAVGNKTGCSNTELILCSIALAALMTLLIGVGETIALKKNQSTKRG